MNRIEQIPKYTFSCVFRFEPKKESEFWVSARSWDKQKASLSVLGDGPSFFQPNLVCVTVQNLAGVCPGMLALAARPGAAAAFPRVPLPVASPGLSVLPTFSLRLCSSAYGGFGGCVTPASNYAGNVGFVGFYD